MTSAQRGFVVKLNDQGCSGVVPLRHMNDTKDIKAKVNTKVNVRVLQYDYFEEVFVIENGSIEGGDILNINENFVENGIILFLVSSIAE